MDKNEKVETVSISLNGAPEIWAKSLVPSLEGELAIVHLSVIQRLASLLPKANASQIIENFSYRLRDVSTMEEFVALLEDELAFQKTVNVITTIGKENIEPIPVVASSYASNGEDEESCLE